MRRVLIWIVRTVAFIGCIAVVIWAGFLTIDLIGKHRIKTIAERAPSAYIKEQAPKLILDHVRIIDGTGAAPLEDQAIAIEAGKISYAGPRSQQPQIPGAKG